MYRPESGYGFGTSVDGSTKELLGTIAQLQKTVDGLQAQVSEMQQSSSSEEAS